MCVDRHKHKGNTRMAQEIRQNICVYIYLADVSEVCVTLPPFSKSHKGAWEVVLTFPRMICVFTFCSIN